MMAAAFCRASRRWPPVFASWRARHWCWIRIVASFRCRCSSCFARACLAASWYFFSSRFLGSFECCRRRLRSAPVAAAAPCSPPASRSDCRSSSTSFRCRFGTTRESSAASAFDVRFCSAAAAYVRTVSPAPPASSSSRRMSSAPPASRTRSCRCRYATFDSTVSPVASICSSVSGSASHSFTTATHVCSSSSRCTSAPSSWPATRASAVAICISAPWKSFGSVPSPSPISVSRSGRLSSRKRVAASSFIRCAAVALVVRTSRSMNSRRYAASA